MSRREADAERLHWREVSRERLQDCRVFSVSRTLAETPDGSARHPFFRIDSADWVNVIPLTGRGDVVMVRQYRHGAGAVTLEIPGGMVDAGEDPAAAAARELLEETGYRAERIEPLGSVNPNPALFGNRLHAFVALGAREVAPIRNDAREQTVVEIVPRDALQRLVREGRVDHALVLAALLFFELSQPR
jgi:8-oxo-dGTP pyrophosphatase MutT (NUDIX family)